MIPVKTAEQIEQMRVACKIAANVLDRLCQLAEPGVNTYDLDQEGRRLIEAAGAVSACYNYGHGNHRFPSYTCLSVNDEIVHGIGKLSRVLEEGDVISVDVSLVHNGWIGDNCRTVGVGQISDEAYRLLEVTEQSLYLGIEEARSGHRVGYISNAVEKYVRRMRYGIVREFVGHGVGRSMHEEPQIPNFGSRNRGDYLRPGMTLAIEPMITAGRSAVKMDSDGWTARTKDGSLAAHFEHTVLVTNGEPEILTLPDSWAGKVVRQYEKEFVDKG
ncbi:MAG: type I methionyl aminopeptidase [Verrucomicrobiota bacterium JB022]|nr:type I methionyl aminopeptidase [Verrucomicrobiota bacterium JB022]